MVPAMPSEPPAPLVADGLPGVNVVSVAGRGADLTDHNSGPPLTHQFGIAGCCIGAFNGKSAAPAASNAPQARAPQARQAFAAANNRIKGASRGRPVKESLDNTRYACSRILFCNISGKCTAFCHNPHGGCTSTRSRGEISVLSRDPGIGGRRDRAVGPEIIE